MATVISFLIGVVVGGVVMFFICRNNSKKFAEKEAALKAELAAVKAKAGEIKDIVKG
jgi:preprotein translocase subunit YajC